MIYAVHFLHMSYNRRFGLSLHAGEVPGTVIAIHVVVSNYFHITPVYLPYAVALMGTSQ